ncbi:MAG: efflux RND transporter periplasmic adaptor subunit [Magnetococcales bacterium]|nr:efflux RND transporter periplasmic adaptor subunit [Magnetococcales bacterium]
MPRNASHIGCRIGPRLGWVACFLLLIPAPSVGSTQPEAPTAPQSGTPTPPKPPTATPTSTKTQSGAPIPQKSQTGLPAPAKPSSEVHTLPKYEPDRTTDETEEIRAQLTPRQKTVIGAEITAKIQHIHVAEGESFTQGKVLIEFDCSLLQTRLRKAAAEVEASRKRVEVHARLMELGSLSPLELELDRLELARNIAEVTTHQTMVNRCRIRAPFPGHVITMQAQPFQYVTEGQHLLEILNNAELELALIVPSRWLPRLSPGMPFTVHIDETGRDYPALVVRPVPQVEAVSQSIKVIARLDGRFPELISGMNGRVHFPELSKKSKP